MKLMFHYINKEKNSSPTIVANRIKELIANDSNVFCNLNQNISANGIISIKLIKYLITQIKAEKPDIVILSGIASAFHAAIACKVCKIKKIILITHGIDSLSPDRSLIKRKIFKYIIEPITVMMCTHIQCNSEFVYNLKLMKMFAKNKRYLIPNPMPIYKDFQIKFEKKNINKFTIVSASRIIKNKGYDILTDAIKELSNLNINFIIAGDGSYLPQMKDDLKELQNVSFLGKVDNSEILNIIKNADLFVLPSNLYETYGLVYLEAALMKIPSICGNKGAAKEFVNSENGYVLSRYDAHELACLIRKAYDNKSELKKKGIRAYNDAIKLNSNAKIAQKLFSLYT